MKKEASLNPIAVMGAGAVGCYYGGMLARAGHDVTLVARAQHVEAVQKRGLRMETKAFDANVPVQASAEASGARGAKLVLFSVKSTDTERAGAALAPYVEPEAVVLSLQNGVDNAERLAATLGRDVVPAVVYVAVEMAGPGHVRHHGRSELLIGRSPAGPRIAATMPGQFSSTAQDLARGKPTEIDHLNGFVVRKGDALGVPTPANRMLLALVKLLEERGSPRG